MRTTRFPTFAILLTVALFFFTASAQAEDKSSGCGMGWKVAKRDSLLSSMTRAYVNATFSSTAGMTSGTSGCSQHSIVQNDRAGEHFAEANFHNLLVEMAEGRGEHVEGFAAVLGCESGAQAAFNRMSQENYPAIFPTDEVGPTQMLRNVRGLIERDPTLRGQCRAIAG